MNYIYSINVRAVLREKYVLILRNRIFEYENILNKLLEYIYIFYTF